MSKFLSNYNQFLTTMQIKQNYISRKSGIEKNKLPCIPTRKQPLQKQRSLLGNKYDIKTDFWKGKLSKDKFIASDNEEDTYILARSYGDYDGDGTKEHHWIALEGFSTDDKGRMVFTYDGTSDNDVDRIYIWE